jgi:hypothetical protein
VAASQQAEQSVSHSGQPSQATAQAAHGWLQQVAEAAGGRAQQAALSVGFAQQADASGLLAEPDEKNAAIGQPPSQVLQRLYW